MTASPHYHDAAGQENTPCLCPEPGTYARQAPDPLDAWVLDEAEALLDMDGRREALRSAIEAWRAGTLQTVDAATALERIEARIQCPMCGEPRSGPPEPWCAGKENHEEE